MANSVDPDRSSLFWVHAVCFYTYFVSKARQLFAAGDFSRPLFQMLYFLALKGFMYQQIQRMYVPCLSIIFVFKYMNYHQMSLKIGKQKKKTERPPDQISTFLAKTRGPEGPEALT